MEEWVIDACRDEPHKAIEYVLETDWVAKEGYHKNPTEFYKRLARQLSRKSVPRNLSSDRWKRALIAAWDFSVKGYPPYCLWSDAAIVTLLRGPRASELATRKAISRLGFYRPKSPCYGIEIVSSESFRWVKRSRGAVTNKK